MNDEMTSGLKAIGDLATTQVESAECFLGIAHILCGLVIGQGMITSDELATALDEQAHRIGRNGPNGLLQSFAKSVATYDARGPQLDIIDGGKPD